MNTNANREPRPLLRRRSSIGLKVADESRPCKSGKTMLLSVLRSSTLALVTSLFCAYAWVLTIGVGSSYVTFSLIESAHDTLQSLEEERQVIQSVLEDLQTQTQAARLDLELSKNTCRIPGASFDDFIGSSESYAIDD